MAQSPRWLLPLLAVLSFASSACALVQGVGSFVGGRLATRLARPLVACGVAEALVGITAFATPFVLEALTQVWVSVHAELPDSLFALTVIRFIVAFLVLIVPTSHDGRHPAGHHQVRVAREERGGGKIGLLYAINTTGAIVGALVAGFYFISEVGVADSFEIAAAANVAIGLIAIFAAFSRGPVPDPYSMPAAPAATAETAGPANHLALWVFFISGLLLLALEIIWLRMLAVFLRPTAYAFTILLACVFPMKPGHAKRIYIAGPEEMKAFVGDRQLLSDDKPITEFFLSLPKNDGPGGYHGQRGVFEAILTP